MTARKKKDGSLSPVAAEVQPELLHLADKISRIYKLKNGKTALYWHLVAVINDHILRDNIKRLNKDGCDGG